MTVGHIMSGICMFNTSQKKNVLRIIRVIRIILLIRNTRIKQLSVELS